MAAQTDLNGNVTHVKKEKINKTTLKLTAAAFTISISEAGQDQLDKLHEEADTNGLRRWAAYRMKLKDKDLLHANEEGMDFQNDLEELVKEL